MEKLIEFLEDINATIVLFCGLIGGILYLAHQIKNLKKSMKEYTKKMFQDEFDAIHGDNKALSKKLDKVDENATRNFLVRCIADFDSRTKVNEALRIRFWEQYDHYTDPKGMDGNSYIKTSVKRLLDEKKIFR